MKCVNSSSSNITCATSTEIDKSLTGAKFNFRPMNAYVNFDNYTSPIIPYLDDQIYWEIMPSLRKKSDIYL